LPLFIRGPWQLLTKMKFACLCLTLLVQSVSKLCCRYNPILRDLTKPASIPYLREVQCVCVCLQSLLGSSLQASDPGTWGNIVFYLYHLYHGVFKVFVTNEERNRGDTLAPHYFIPAVTRITIACTQLARSS
jgi:hypothetical protein